MNDIANNDMANNDIANNDIANNDMANNDIANNDITNNDISENVDEEDNKKVNDDKNNINSKKNNFKIKKWIPLAVSLFLLILGVSLNIALLRATNDERLFMLGGLNPQLMVRIVYILWTIGGVALPYTIYYCFGKQKKFGWVINSILTFILMIGCLFLSIKDEQKIAGGGIENFDYYTDGTHRMVIMNCYTLNGSNLQQFYIQDDKYYYYWYAGGTANAVIEWREDGAVIVENGEDCLICPYDLFYINK